MLEIIISQLHQEINQPQQSLWQTSGIEKSPIDLMRFSAQNFARPLNCNPSGYTKKPGHQAMPDSRTS
ncbi:MAG: hypothetical protein IKW64_07045 [Clostridia bacterium]|nr:hypothetical protein [Clostridia bacterium]